MAQLRQTERGCREVDPWFPSFPSCSATANGWTFENEEWANFGQGAPEVRVFLWRWRRLLLIMMFLVGG